MSARFHGTVAALALVVGLASPAMAQAPHPRPHTVEKADQDPAAAVKRSLLGRWTSIAPEVRPSAARSADGALKPFYLSRTFAYLPDDRFQLDIVNSADPYGAVPLAKITIRGHIAWQGPHPIVQGAQKVEFTADEGYEVTPLAQGFADVLGKIAADGYEPWKVGSPQSVFGKAFVPFGLKPGVNFAEFDLIYVRGDLLFWGARNVDGRGFDTEQNRPTNLQIPLVRETPAKRR